MAATTRGRARRRAAPAPRRSIGLLAAALLVAACRGGDPPASRDGATPVGPESDAERLERVLSLPYLGFSSSAAGPGESGVVARDAARSWPGFSFYTNQLLCSARLIDPSGQPVREWRAASCGKWANGRLLPDGSIVVVAWDSRPEHREERDRARHVLKLDWDRREVFRARVAAHHDLDVLPDGRILVLTARMRRLPAIDADLPTRDSVLTMLTPDGVVLEERSLYDLLAAAPSLHTFEKRRPRGEGDEAYVDLLHANAVDWFEGGALAGRDPLYAAGHVLVTFRNQSLLAIVDWEEARVLWTFGPGTVEGPHFGRLLETGNILLFDNGVVRGWSRALEIDPLTREIVWELDEGPAGRFYSGSRGSVQRLPNGNTLIAVSDAGEAFEVTPEGEAVWRFFNPETNEENQRATFFSVIRHGGDIVEEIRRHRSGAAAASR